MKIKALECPKCGDLIYSRARHDLHFCGCSTVGIDGGFDYRRIIITVVRPELNPRSVEIEVNASRQELWDDWNEGRDKYGIIKSPSHQAKGAQSKQASHDKQEIH